MHSGHFSRRIKKGMEEEEAPGSRKLGSASPTGRVPREQAGKHKKFLRAQSESQNLGWERSPRSLNPTIYPTLPRPKHVPRCCKQGPPLLNPCRDGDSTSAWPPKVTRPFPYHSKVLVWCDLLYTWSSTTRCVNLIRLPQVNKYPWSRVFTQCPKQRWFTPLPSHRDLLWKEEAQLQRRALIQWERVRIRR